VAGKSVKMMKITKVGSWPAFVAFPRPEASDDFFFLSHDCAEKVHDFLSSIHGFLILPVDTFLSVN
jgi:hypothetical protein